MPWNYIKCENYGSIGACRNRETTEPGIFMLPALRRFFLIISLCSTTAISCKWLVQGQTRGREETEQQLGVLVEGKRHLAMRNTETALALLCLSDFITPGWNFFCFLFYLSGLHSFTSMKMDMVPAAFCRVRGRALFLDFQDLFHSITSCSFCEVRNPCLHGLRVQPSSQGLCRVRSVF